MAVSAGAVRAVLVRRWRVVWKSEAPFEPGADLAAALGTLLHATPRRRLWRTPVAGVAIGSFGSQVKRLTGIAPGAGAEMVTNVVRLNTRRFFAHNGGAVVIAPAIRRGSDWWTAALDAPTVDSAAAACRNANVTLAACAPVVAALGTVLVDGQFAWHDGAVADEVTIAGGVCTRAARRLHPTGDAIAFRKPLSGVGADGIRFADAIAAAFVTDASVFAVDPGRAARLRRRHRAVRAALSVLAVVAAVISAVGPAGQAMLAERRATARLAELGVMARPALEAVREIEAVSEASRRVRDFSASRRSASAFISAVAHALPDSATIVTLRIDSVSASVVTLALPGAPVVTSLARVSGVLQATVAGAVTREAIAGVSYQRTSVALRMTPPRPGTALRASAHTDR